ncbi:hypothetical protein Vafri_10963 [Volvox africanus]|nr:hypothetical protein Vafri_10963 [Volvox africanus]
MAVMGGAIALSRVSKDTLVSECIFKNNSVVDPRAWNFSSSPTAPQLAFIDPGYGGAIYAFYSTIALQTIAIFIGNSAKFGGAMAVMSSPTLRLLMQIYGRASEKAIFTVPVDMEVAESARLAEPVLPYRMLFANNTALIGGAMYVSDTKGTAADMNLYQSIRGQETNDSRKFQTQPGILFLGNSANGGGALYLEGNGQISLKSCRFVANRAVVPSTKPSDTALSGRNLDNARAKALPCYNGGGGGICVVGQANMTLSLSRSDLLYNGAKDGAGIYIAEGLDCIKQAGCYSVVLDQVNMAGNAAANRGGGLFWLHEGVLQISTCASDKEHVIKTNGMTRINSSADVPTSSDTFNISLRAPMRKSPSVWYQQLTAATQDEMLADVGGAVRKGKRVVYASSGSIVVKGNVVYAMDADPNAILQTPDQGPMAVKNAYFNPARGTIVIPDGNDTSAVQPSWEPVPAVPVVLHNDVLIDPAWYGVPYTELPCFNWNNSADTGPDVSSTPYFLMSPSRRDFYTSNTDIKINVTVHDWLGQNCTGGNDTQPLILVQADSPDVSGAITVTSVNGTAEFTALRLRAREGLHTVNMTGRSQLPVRELLASQVRIYVRPCAINEFASPKNLDECIPCDVGSYNFNVSSVSCIACPDNAHCSYPDPAACKLGTKCDPMGFLVPQEGYWHSNLFSEEVIECTNSDACTAPNRSARLSEMQLTIWKAAQEIQFDAANLAADQAAKEALALQLSSKLDQGQRRRLLQDKAIGDDAYVLLVLNATVDMLSDYMQNQCAPGYTGTLCGECMPGYGWRRIATCSKCPPQVLNNLYYALVTLLTLSLLAFTVYSSLKEQRRPGLLVGGISSNKDKAKQAGKAPKANSTGHSGLGVQASGPSQFHVILAAAAAEDAAAEAAPALALLREQRSCTAMGDIDLMAPCEYVDSVMVAARNQFSSAPGTPKGTRAAAAPFHLVDTAVRAHSVLSVPARASRWTCVEESRRIAASFTKTDRIGILGAGLAGAVAADAAAAACHSNHSATAGGPVAEGMERGYDNAVFDSQMAGGGSTTTNIQPLEEIEAEQRQQQQQPPGVVLVEVDEFGATSRVSPAFRLTPPAPSRPIAESKDYTNVLYEDPQAPPAEIQDTNGGISGAGTSVRGGMPTISTKPLRRSLEGDVGGAETSSVGDVRDMLGFSHLVPQGVVMQSVPVLHSNSPPRTPLHASVVSALPGALELPTVTERVRIGEIPRRGKVLGRERAHQSTVVKIFVSYVQVLALLQNVPLEIPGVVDVYYRINNQAISYPGILVSLDCSLPDAGISKAFVRVILTVLAPLYIFAGAVIFFLAFNVVDYYILAPYFVKHPTKRSRKRHLKLESFGMHLKVYLGRQLIVTFIAIFFFFYPSVVQSLMAIFNCQDVNVQESNNPLANGLGLRMERIWSQDYGLTCYKRSHLALTLGLGVPGVLLIAIGWPLMSALFMTGKLTMLNNIQITEDMTSFFLADFKARFAWWESVIMLRKLFIAVIVTLVDGSTYAGVQLLLVICILVVAAGLHLVAMPYHHVYTNNLELVSLCTLLATLYFSLYFGFSSSISNGGRIAISILILVINIIMVVVFIYYIIQAYFYAALLSSGLGDIDSETRRKLTPAEIQQRILENLIAQGSTTSYNQDGQQQQQQPGERQRTSYNRVASLYATAMWYSMRVGSTTNKVLTRMKTLLRDPQGSYPPSREGSILVTDVDGVPPHFPERPSAAGNARTSPGCNTTALGDPEEGRGSATSRKRSMSGPGTTPPARSERTSLRSTGSGKAKDFRSAERSHSQSTPGIAMGSTSQSSSSTGGGGGAANILGAGASQLDEVVAAAASAAVSPRAAAQVISRACSAASLDNVSLPPFPSELPDASGAVASEVAPVEVGITPVVVTLQPPPPLPQPVVAPAAPAVMNPRPRAVRSPSRLAHVSGQANRTGELLPPPPSFPGRGGA